MQRRSRGLLECLHHKKDFNARTRSKRKRTDNAGRSDEDMGQDLKHANVYELGRGEERRRRREGVVEHE